MLINWLTGTDQAAVRSEVPIWDEGMAPVPWAEEKTQASSPQGLEPTGANLPGLLPTMGDQGKGA